MQGAIDALVGAIKALKDSKAQIAARDPEAKLDFAQLRANVGRVLHTIQRSSSVKPTEDQLAAVQMFIEGGKQAPKSYTYQSNDIIGTLEGLLVEFKENKKELDKAEFDTNAAFEKEKLGMEKEKKFAEKEKAEAEELLATKEEELATAKEELAQETYDMNADQAFLKELTTTCEEKATMFDQRSSTRSAELTAISEAISVLESGTAPNYSANKKLVDLQRGARIKAFAQTEGGPVEDRALSFLQRGSASARQGLSLNKMLTFIEGAAQRLGSPVLATLSVKAKVQIDHFVKVRGLIKDFIAKLEADAEAEAETKSFCDKEMAKAIESRDAEQAKIETLAADISMTESEIAQLKAEIEVLSEQIAELYKALKEATELREAEKAENMKTIAEAEEGLAATKMALTILSEFYENAFLQKGKYVPPNADRDGNTVSDLAPEIFDDTYHGNQEASKGIIGLLEVIVSDFERTIETTTKEEKEAEDKFQDFKKETEADIDSKEKSKKEKENKVLDLTDKLADLQDQMKEAKDALETALKELEKLKPMCVEGEETWEERKAKREQEIEALKQALEILDNWQS